MPLPDVPEIRDALSLIDLSPSKPIGATSAVQLPSRPAIDQAGQVYQEPPLWLHYSPRARIPLNSLVARIGKDLEAAGHKGDDGFGLFVIGLAMLARSRDEDAARNRRAGQ